MDNTHIAQKVQDEIKDIITCCKNIRKITDNEDILSELRDIENNCDNADDYCDDIEDCEEPLEDCQCENLNVMQGIEEMHFYAPNLVDEQMMEVINDYLIKHTPLQLIELLTKQSK